jgi:hypothetical protein
MKKVLMFLLMLALSCPVWAVENDVDYPADVRSRLDALWAQMDALRAADDYDEAVWTEFYTIIYGSGRNDLITLNQGGDSIAVATPITTIPYLASGTTCGYANNYNPTCDGTSSRGKDVVYSYTPGADVTVQVSLCGSRYDTKLYIYKNSTSNRIACSDNDCGSAYWTDRSVIDCITLEANNTYYIVVDGYGLNTCGDYELRVVLCGCGHAPDGITQNDDGTYTFRQTTNGSSTAPLYEGPWHDHSNCGPSDNKGFGFSSAYDQDYGWKHYWPDWNTPGLTVSCVKVTICANDVDEHACNLRYPGEPYKCELDKVTVDGVAQNPTYLSGDNEIDWPTTFDIAAANLLDNGYLDVWLDINELYGQGASVCWVTELSWSQLEVCYRVSTTENHPPYTPEGYGMSCVDDNSNMCVTITGPTPADPDGDNVDHTYRWYVANAGTNYTFVDDETNPNHFGDDHDGPCIPASDSDIGDIWKVQVFAVDVHGAQSLNYLEVTFSIIVYDCGEPPYTDVDMGDLNPCSYPTLVNNPAHGLSNIAWLGDLVTPEATPYGVNLDPGDDGVQFLDTLWIPCETYTVMVKITAGNNYPAYADTGGMLYLNAWKDGNIDGDFCDFLCDGNAPEWFIRDSLVTPSTAWQAFTVIDPGLPHSHTPYDGVFRFRLTSHRVGMYGFGMVDRVSCQGMTCGSFDKDFLGEVEDYVFEDFQLAIEMGSFDAIAAQDRITLRWNTVSESNNDHFDVERNGNVVSRVNSFGDSPSGHSYEWVDNTVQASVNYTYTLYAVDVNGTRKQMASVMATPANQPVTITEYALYQNYPNPFNPKTNIVFDLVENGTVTLNVYNPVGQLVATVVNGSLSAGRHTVMFDASNLPSGMYLYRLEAPGFTATQKMLLMK